MTDLKERLRAWADQGDFGRGPNPGDLRRLAAARIETLEAALCPFANATAIHFDHFEGDIMMVLTYPSGEPTGANLMSLKNARAALKDD